MQSVASVAIKGFIGVDWYNFYSPPLSLGNMNASVLTAFFP